MARRMVDAAAPGIVGRYVLVGYRDDGRSQDGRLRCYMAGSPLSSRLCYREVGRVAAGSSGQAFRLKALIKVTLERV